jgi:hypothetical protein
VIRPHTWFAHWLALTLDWVVDDLDPLELELPVQAVSVRPVATATTERATLPALRPPPV